MTIPFMFSLSAHSACERPLSERLIIEHHLQYIPLNRNEIVRFGLFVWRATGGI